MSSTRGLSKQELKRATGNINWAIEHLARVIIIYKDVHPEIALPLIEVVEGLEIAIETIAKIDGEI